MRFYLEKMGIPIDLPLLRWRYHFYAGGGLRDTEFAPLSPLLQVRDTDRRFDGIRDTEFAPLMPAAAAVQYEIRDTGYGLGPKYRVLIRN